MRIEVLLGLPLVSYPVPGKRPIHEDDVRRIRDMFWVGEKTLKHLALLFSLSVQTVFLLVHNLTYWWVT